jgi:hypothetical protein
MNEPEYVTTKEDIATMLRFLRLHVPAHATPEKAVYLLEQQRLHLKSLEDLHPEMIEEILKDFESR